MAESPSDWRDDLFAALGRLEITVIAHVPDAGLARLIARSAADPQKIVVALTREEEGIGLLAGAWLGGLKGVLLTQSSGVGNCLNALAMAKTCRFPILMVVAMRGEWGEFNPWQMPIGETAESLLRTLGAAVVRADRADDAVPAFEAAAALADHGQCTAAVLLAQRLIGTKRFAP